MPTLSNYQLSATIESDVLATDVSVFVSTDSHFI
jgi:hypothetical protein